MNTDRSLPATAHQFDDLAQQRDVGISGMWIFLATEILLFGGLLLGYTAYRILYPEAFHLGSQHTQFWKGTINTAVLLTSSLTMALAVGAAQQGRSKVAGNLLFLTLLLGLTFLGIKFWEWNVEWHEGLVPGLHWKSDAFPAPLAPNVQMFWLLYFFLTGLHAVHLSIGCLLVFVLMLMAWSGKFSKTHNSPVEITGLYWHLVDIVWVVLYPLLYLVGTR